MYCDASDIGLGFFMQQGHAIAYALRKIKMHECNFSTHELELAVVVFSLKIWRD